jgi:long-chain fatty acid transport protein
MVAPHVVFSHRLGFPPPDDNLPDGSTTVDGVGQLSCAVQAGIVFRPNEAWSIGASYRGRLRAEIADASVTFADIPSTLKSRYPDGSASTDLHLPEDLRLGVMCRPFGWLSLGAETQYVRWARMDNIFVDFENPSLPAEDVEENWENTLTYRFGTELGIAGFNIRAGVVFDQTPIPDAYLRPSNPDADRTGISAGIGYAVADGLTLDFAYVHYKYKDRAVTNSLVEYRPGGFFNGTYTSALTVVVFNVSYSWN